MDSRKRDEMNQARPGRQVVFSEHALERVADRGVERAHVEAAILRPTLSGPAENGARWATGVVMIGGRRTFVTAIYAVDASGAFVVVTAYLGPPSRIRVADGARR